MCASSGSGRVLSRRNRRPAQPGFRRTRLRIGRGRDFACRIQLCLGRPLGRRAGLENWFKRPSSSRARPGACPDRAGCQAAWLIGGRG